MASVPIAAAVPDRAADNMAAQTLSHGRPHAGSGLWMGVPWFCWASALSVTCAVVGLHLDISWHRSIGRDSFWNPAHMVLYSSGVLAAIASGFLILKGTLSRDPEVHAHTVHVWGLRAPLGAFVAAWGGLGILYDALFDNWWHNAYGLDVRFTSPPHLLFSLSLWFEMLGGLLLVLSWLNRAQTPAAERSARSFHRGRLQAIVLYLGALMATAQLFACFSYTWDTKLHNARAYIAVAIFLPVLLAIMAAVTGHRWAATIITSIYTVLIVGLILVLPLFPATPRLGPIFIPVTHFIPPRFPLLVVVPALALDLLWQRTQTMRSSLRAVLGGIVFTLLLAAAEWPFASFLVSPASANRFFGTRYLGFDDLTAPPGASLWQFDSPQHGLHLAAGLALAALIAAAMLYAGRFLGERLRLVRR